MIGVLAFVPVRLGFLFGGIFLALFGFCAICSRCFTFLIGVLACVYLLYRIYYQWKRLILISNFPSNSLFFLCLTRHRVMELYLHPRSLLLKGCTPFGVLYLLGDITTSCCLVLMYEYSWVGWTFFFPPEQNAFLAVIRSISLICRIHFYILL